MKAELFQVVSGAIRAGTAVIFSNQDGNRPARPFCTLLVTGAQRPGHASVGEIDDQGQATIKQDQSVTVSIQVFGTDALEIVEELRDQMEAPSAQLLMHDQGLMFVQVVAGVNDAAAVIGAGWEARAQMDVEFRTLREFVDDVGLIETVELSGDIGGYQTTETIGV